MSLGAPADVYAIGLTRKNRAGCGPKRKRHYPSGNVCRSSQRYFLIKTFLLLARSIKAKRLAPATTHLPHFFTDATETRPQVAQSIM